MAKSEIYDMCYQMQLLLINVATTGHTPDVDIDYKKTREKLINTTIIKNLLPDWLSLNRDLTQFWQFIKHKYPTYAERRHFIYDAFAPALLYLERQQGAPVEFTATEKLKSYGANYINEEWNKMLERKSTDAMGAITSSRTLIETVCKYILDELKVSYDPKADLPVLYKLSASNLNLSPGQHNEQIFKQILNGCQSVVEGLGALRNAHGDAHGKSQSTHKPDQRHASLAVNLAGTMAMFLLETFENKKESELAKHIKETGKSPVS
jgi:hypothetical protein